jgi:hypothetical protein
MSSDKVYERRKPAQKKDEATKRSDIHDESRLTVTRTGLKMQAIRNQPLRGSE